MHPGKPNAPMRVLRDGVGSQLENVSLGYIRNKGKGKGMDVE